MNKDSEMDPATFLSLPFEEQQKVVKIQEKIIELQEEILKLQKEHLEGK